MANKTNPVSRRNDLVVQELDGEVLIYDLLSNKAYCLNETSARVWTACDGESTVSDIGSLLGSEDVAWLALNDLKKENLIEHESPTPVKFAGMSRREVVKKVGLSSMLALPLIASLVAPAAAQTGTCSPSAPGCLPNGNVNCTSPQQCCSCNCQTNGNCTS